MTFLEPIIAAVVGAGVTAFVVRFNKTKAATTLAKYGPLATKAYNILDPVLDKNMKNWSGSQVDQAFTVVTEVLADGQLSPDEVKHVATQLAVNWLPAKAADKVRQYEASEKLLPQVAIAAAVADHVNGLANKASVFTAARKLTKN
jgi:hypothetical protein